MALANKQPEPNNTPAGGLAPPVGCVSAEMVSRYLGLGAQIATLEAERAHLRDIILLALDNGLKVAADSPWEVFKVIQDRAAVPWREVATEWIKKAVGDRCAGVISRLEAKHRLKVTLLQKRPNAAYVAQQGGIHAFSPADATTGSLEAPEGHPGEGDKAA